MRTTDNTHCILRKQLASAPVATTRFTTMLCLTCISFTSQELTGSDDCSVLPEAQSLKPQQTRAQPATSVILRISETKQDGIINNSPFELRHKSYSCGCGYPISHSFPATVRPNEYCHIFVRKLDTHTAKEQSLTPAKPGDLKQRDITNKPFKI